MKIHREGKTILIVVFSVLAIINAVGFYFFSFSSTVNYITGFISLILFLMVLQFFRDPLIRVSVNPSYILAPADGKIVVIEKVFEPECLNEDRIQISIFMSPVNVHVNRNPVSGIVKYFKYHPGKYLVAWHPKSSAENERTTLMYELPSRLKIVMRQIAGVAARRIRCYAKVGDEVTQGEEMGFIKFGSRVDVFVPVNANIKVNLGDKSKGGKTILAELV